MVNIGPLGGQEFEPRLVAALQDLGSEYGPLGVAYAASRMTDADALIAKMEPERSIFREPKEPDEKPDPMERLKSCDYAYCQGDPVVPLPESLSRKFEPMPTWVEVPIKACVGIGMILVCVLVVGGILRLLLSVLGWM